VRLKPEVTLPPSDAANASEASGLDALPSPTASDVGDLYSGERSRLLGQMRDPYANQALPRSSDSRPGPVGMSVDEIAQLREYVKACVLCTSFDSTQLDELVSRMRRTDLAAGESAEVSGQLGVVFKGRASIGERGASAAEPARELATGSVFGELEILHDHQYSDDPSAAARLTALEPSVACSLPRAQFLHVVEFTQHALISTNERLLRSMPMCEQMGTTERIKIASALSLKVCEDARVLIKEGEPGDRFFIVREGKLSVRREGVEIDFKYKGDFIGETALLSDQPRNATVVCVGHCELLCMSKSDFLRLLGPLQDILNRNEEDRAHLMLAGVSLLGTLTASERATLVQLLQESTFERGDTIFEEGSRGDHLYILKSGSVEVTKGGKWIDKLDTGAFFGERALINDEPRMATVTATTPSVALTLSRADFRTILRNQKDLQRLLADRHHTEDTRRLQELRVFKLVGKGASGKVHLLYHTPSAQLYALKSMRKRVSASTEHRARVIRERQVLAGMLPHPLIGALYNTYQVRAPAPLGPYGAARDASARSRTWGREADPGHDRCAPSPSSRPPLP
jgi:CRP-like cAMP-binding protein